MCSLGYRDVMRCAVLCCAVLCCAVLCGQKVVTWPCCMVWSRVERGACRKSELWSPKEGCPSERQHWESSYPAGAQQYPVHTGVFLIYDTVQ